MSTETLTLRRTDGLAHKSEPHHSTFLHHPHSPDVIQVERYPENVALIRESRPDYGLAIQVKVLDSFEVVPSSLGSGQRRETLAGRGIARSGPSRDTFYLYEFGLVNGILALTRIS